MIKRHLEIFTILGYKLCCVQHLNQGAYYWGQPNIKSGSSEFGIPSGTKLMQKLMADIIT